MMVSNVRAREELVCALHAFDAEPVIERYRQEWAMKLPFETLRDAADHKILRAFRHETPSRRYRQWRWHRDPALLLGKMDAVRGQEEFDCLVENVGSSLVEDWGQRDNDGHPTRMTIGLALKITNVTFKHLAFSRHSRNPRLKEWLHVPWDRYTLNPLRFIWKGRPPIPCTPRQGFVTDIQIYRGLHALISAIARDAGVPRVNYEFFAWDSHHQQEK